MAKPNYSYEKRQRELEKKKKKEEKAMKKSSGDNSGSQPTPEQADPHAPAAPEADAPAA
jgi:hypothetical protein